MKLAFSTNAFTENTIDRAVEAIHRIGYEGIEIMADQPHCWPLDRAGEEWDRIKQACEAVNLVICNINAFMMKTIGDIHHPTWIEEDAANRSLRLAHTEASLEMAKRMGSPSISTEPGGPLEGVTRLKAIALFKQGLSRVAPLAEQLGIRLLIEPEPGLLLERLDETISFLDECDHSALGINFDVGHFFCVNEDPAALIRAFPERLEHIHIEDIARDRVHRHLIPGEGAIDYKSLFAALHGVGYQGYLTVELYPYEATPVEAAKKAYDFLKPFLQG
ncbi:MAG: sugar phosphate isomerase/epimerase [Planctomycetes bacterium]|nr:sugar phosphate isomerase/epimerase [Planctomycetota bacterium]